MNLAYKHLQDQLRLAELTIGQWLSVVVGVVLALGWGLYLSPFGWIVTLFSAIYVAGLPALGAVLAGLTEFDLLGFISAAWRWWRAPGRFAAGVGEPPAGYVVHEQSESAEGAQGAAVALEPQELWA